MIKYKVFFKHESDETWGLKNPFIDELIRQIKFTFTKK